jgi:hypothetical protein
LHSRGLSRVKTTLPFPSTTSVAYR